MYTERNGLSKRTEPNLFAPISAAHRATVAAEMAAHATARAAGASWDGTAWIYPGPIKARKPRPARKRKAA